MAKDIGYTYAIATRNPKKTFVFCKWFSDKQKAIDYAVGEIKDRSQYDVEFILIREGTKDAKDPVVWDSRKDMPEEPVGSNVYLTGEEQSWLKAVKLASGPEGESLEDANMRCAIFSKLLWNHQLEKI